MANHVGLPRLGTTSPLLGFCLCILWGCSGPAPISGTSVTGPVSLLQHFPGARKTTAPPADVASYVNVVEIRVEKEPEQALFLHAPSEVVFALRLERASVLDTAIAVDPAAWAQGGDGVTFYVAVRTEGEDLRTYLFSRHLSPRLVEADRGWQPFQLNLSPYRNRDIELILGTHPGPDFNSDYDRAVWREPLLYNPILDSEWVRTARQPRGLQ